MLHGNELYTAHVDVSSATRLPSYMKCFIHSSWGPTYIMKKNI